MKTKIYKSYTRAAKIATTESILVGSADRQAFAHRADLRDFGDSTVAERTFSWMPNDKRTLRIFRMRNGDFGFVCFGSGVGPSNHASRIFGGESEALTYLNTLADGYLNSDKGWKEV